MDIKEAEGVIEALEAIDWVSEANIEAVLSAMDAQEAAEATIDEECGWEHASAVYREAQAARRPLRDRLSAGVGSVRGKILAWLKKDGGTHPRVYARRITPEVVIEDPEKVPDEYKVVVIDEAKIKRIADALGVETSIPGVKVMNRYTVAIKKKEQ